MDSVYVDLSGVYNAISRAQSNINSNLEVVNDNVRAVGGRVGEVEDEVLKLKNELEEMRKEQRFAAALQRAITEVIRVRQELKSKFGTQQLVRENMLGILQATDLGLITESTISRCTEELMLSAPKYWLAPCLIALAAWISNNESLAKRAIAEGYKRDKEKTCLLFALITRRVNAGRMQAGKQPTNTTFEWLARYFSFQDPERMRKSIVAYIDAYANGIFGEDKENICADQIDYWMDELKRRKPGFADEQIGHWKGVFGSFCNVSAMSQYAQLKAVCPQYNDMENFLVRINASERDTGIKSYIGGIMSEPVDTEKLINDIDLQLKYLVEGYEEAEQSLRDEEEELEEIKRLKGDEITARSNIEARRAAKYDAPVDFAQRLSDSIFSKEASYSAKKAALVMLKPYIAEAYKGFISANKDAYPSEIDLQIKNAGKSINSGVKNGGTIVASKVLQWNGKTQNAENREELVASLSEEFEKVKKERVEAISDENANKTIKSGKMIAAVGCILIVPIFIGLMKMKRGKTMLQENADARVAIKNYYDKARTDSIALLNKALDQRQQANDVVNAFTADEKNETINI